MLIYMAEHFGLALRNNLRKSQLTYRTNLLKLFLLIHRVVVGH